MHSPVPCVAVDEREGVNDARRPVASARRAAVDVREAVDDSRRLAPPVRR